VKRHLQRELGVEIMDSGVFFNDGEVRDLLDAITETANGTPVTAVAIAASQMGAP
jgi:hypothetical protein